jgi:YVTN family beta-propeller protein
MSDVNHTDMPRDGHVIRVCNGPISGIAASSDGARLLVANYGHDTVSVVDTETWLVVGTVAGLSEPSAIAIGAGDTNRAYVSTVSPAYDSIGVVDVSTNAVIATHPLALSVSDLAVSPDGKYVYAGRSGARDADVAVLDTATGQVEVIDLPTEPGTTAECMRVSPDGDRLYVATNGPSGGRLVVIAGRRWHVIDTVEIGLPIRGIALSPNGTIAYVASCAPDWSAVVDVVDTRTAKITATRKVGEITGILTGLTLSGDGDRAYLVSDDGVTVLCTLTHDVIGSVEVASRPSCVIETLDEKYLCIADYSGAVTVAPVAPIAASGAETLALESGSSTGCGMPGLRQYEPALA